jgi:hypothetical protein
MEISNTKIIGFIVGIMGVALLPLGGLWALNTLFTTGLKYNLLNWAAVLFAQVYIQLMVKSAALAVTRAENKQKKSK